MKKKALLFLLIIGLCLVVPAEASVENLFPTETEMGYNVNPDEMRYKKYPVEHYSWDTVHEWFKMEGIKPVIGNPNELTTRAILGPIYSFIISINRLAIFCLQLGFNNTVLDPVLQGLESVISPISRFFYNNMFGFLSLILAGVLLAKYARGRKGEGAAAVIKTLVYTALIFGAIDNIDWLLDFVGGLVDYISLSILGIMCLSPVSGDQASTLANSKIIEVSNTLFQLYVENTWLFGEFGSISNIPVVTSAEQHAIHTKVDPSLLSIYPGQAWNELLLSLPDGDVRQKLISILCDPAIQHDPALDTSMLVSGSGGRILITFLALIVNALAAVLYSSIGILQFAGKLGIIVLTLSFIFLVAAAFFGEIGERFLRTAVGLWLFLFFLKVAASLYLGIPIAVITLLNRFNIDSAMYIIVMVLHIILNGLSVVFMPLIWKKLTPALMRATARITDTIGNPEAKLKAVTKNQLARGERVLPPRIRAESSRTKFPKKRPVESSSALPKKKQDPDADKIKNMSPRQEYKYRQKKAKTKEDAAANRENNKTAVQTEDLNKMLKRANREQNRELMDGMKDITSAKYSEQLQELENYREEQEKKHREEKAKEQVQADLKQRQIIKAISASNGAADTDGPELPPPRKY